MDHASGAAEILRDGVPDERGSDRRDQGVPFIAIEGPRTSVLVTYPLRAETLAQMEARWKRGEPMATFSFTVTVIGKERA